VAYTIPDIREPAAAESQEGSPDAKRDLPQTLRNLQRANSKKREGFTHHTEKVNLRVASNDSLRAVIDGTSRD
jgi:predicted DNA binding CopG/RHH family protein